MVSVMIWGLISIRYDKLPLYIKSKKQAIINDLYTWDILERLFLILLDAHNCMLV